MKNAQDLIGKTLTYTCQYTNKIIVEKVGKIVFSCAGSYMVQCESCAVYDNFEIKGMEIS